jgi:hypothetical protein
VSSQFRYDEKMGFNDAINHEGILHFIGIGFWPLQVPSPIHLNW